MCFIAFFLNRQSVGVHVVSPLKASRRVTGLQRRNLWVVKQNGWARSRSTVQRKKKDLLRLLGLGRTEVTLALGNHVGVHDKEA